MYAVIKPQLAVYHRTAEMRMEGLTLSNWHNNVRTFLMNQKDNVLETDHLRGDGVTYDPQLFTTLVFDELVKTNCPNFLDNVKAERAKWIKRPSTFDMPQCIINLTALYMNYNHTGLWDHRWDLPILHYHEIMVIFPYPFFVVITQLFSCIIFINDCICILTGSPG